MRILLILALILTLGAGCSIYRLEVQQGNLLEEKAVAQLRPGMDRQQVTFLMGTPLLQDPFHQDRWDYVYVLRDGRGKILERRHVSLYFEGERLARVERGAQASDPTR